MRSVLTTLIIAMLFGIAAVFSACGHGDPADPYDPDGEVEIELVELSKDYPSTGKYARYAVTGLASDILAASSNMIKAMGYTIALFPSISSYSSKSTDAENADADALNFQSIVIHKEDSGGDPASAAGDMLSVQNEEYDCMIFSNLDFEYDSFMINHYVTINGSGAAKIILTSLDCTFYRNIHAEVVVSGEFEIVTNNPDMGSMNFNELQFTADYRDADTQINIVHSAIDTDDGMMYCFEYDDNTECLKGDLSEPQEENACSSSIFSYRECDPAEDTLYEATFMYKGEIAIDYEVPIICSADGMWSPPCPMDGAFDICPSGTACRASDNVDWGLGLEGYGVCSCAAEQLPPAF